MSALEGKVVVLTGASSGLGREAAIQFAAHGCAVVLAARREPALEETARLCRRAGGSTLSVVTDVTLESDVDRLAERALARFGRIDVWVNNAGVTLFAHLDGASFEEHRRVIETNVYGAMFGARAVLPIFRRQEHGVIINVGSVLSKIGQPFVPSYVISKFALDGLSETLRAELAEEQGIRVCTLLPYAMNTPHFQSGANRIGREARAMPLAQSPKKVARALVKLAERPKRVRYVPRFAVLGLALHVAFPKTTERLLLRALRRWHFTESREAKGEGNLFQPAKEKARVRGRRPPQAGAPAFALWVARELAVMQTESALRLLGRWRHPATPKMAPAPSL